jgi:hypothetical protein
VLHFERVRTIGLPIFVRIDANGSGDGRSPVRQSRATKATHGASEALVRIDLASLLFLLTTFVSRVGQAAGMAAYRDASGWHALAEEEERAYERVARDGG